MFDDYIILSAKDLLSNSPGLLFIFSVNICKNSDDYDDVNINDQYIMCEKKM